MATTANNIGEQVWSSDIEDQSMLIKDTLRGLTNIYNRLRHQEAPDALIERVFELRAELAKTLDDLDEIRVCFPQRPPGY